MGFGYLFMALSKKVKLQEPYLSISEMGNRLR